MAACGVNDPLVDCIPGDMEIHFDYKFATNGDGKPAVVSEMMGHVHLYVFDESTGYLIDIKTVTNEQFKSGIVPANIPVGKYTIVAWGLGHQEHLDEGGFSDVHMLDPESNDYVPVEIGRTTLSTFRLLIADPESGDFDDLFHAVAEGVVLGPKPEKPVQVNFDFIRYTNTLRLTVKGLQHLPEKTANSTRAPHPDLPLDIFVQGKKGTYDHRGQIDPYSPELTYNTLMRSIDDEKTEMDIRLMRLDIRHHRQNPVTLHMHDISAGNEGDLHRILEDLDVLKLIQQAKKNGQYLYQTQAQIDEEDIFDIEIAIEPNPDPDGEYAFIVTIRVAGFEVTDVIPELS